MADLVFSDNDGACSMVFHGMNAIEMTAREHGKLYGMFIKLLDLLRGYLDVTGCTCIPFSVGIKEAHGNISFTAELIECVTVEDMQIVSKYLLDIARTAYNTRLYIGNRRRNEK